MTLKQTVVRGAAWRSAGRIVNQVVQLGMAVVLARLLTPEDYGIVAMAAVFLTFAGIFSELGLSAALVQRKDITDAHVDSVFWASLLLSVVIAHILWFASPWIARFYDEAILVDLVPILALGFVLASLGIVQRALLLRNMNFRALAVVEIGTTATTGIIGIALAVNGYGVWSLVIGSLFGKVTSFILAGLACRWLPGVSFKTHALKDLLRFGGNMTVYNMIDYLAKASDRLIIGKFMGSYSVGIYNRAHALMLAPFTQVIWVLTSVLFPALSSIQDDKTRVNRIFLRALSLTSFIAVPILFGLLAVAEIFVLVVFGDQWSGAVPILRVFCFLGIVQMVIHLLGPVINSQGRPGLLVRLSLMQSVLTLAGVGLGVALQRLEAIALGVTLANSIMLYPYIKKGGGVVGISFSDVYQATSGSLACASVMSLTVWLLNELYFIDRMNWQVLVVEILGGIVVYTLLAFLFKPRGWKELKEVLGTGLVNWRIAQ